MLLFLDSWSNSRCSLGLHNSHVVRSTIILYGMHAVGGMSHIYTILWLASNNHRIMHVILMPCAMPRSCSGGCPILWLILVYMLAQLWLLMTSTLCSHTSRLYRTTVVHSVNSYWGCGKVFHIAN